MVHPLPIERIKFALYLIRRPCVVVSVFAAILPKRADNHITRSGCIAWSLQLSYQIVIASVLYVVAFCYDGYSYPHVPFAHTV